MTRLPANHSAVDTLPPAGTATRSERMKSCSTIASESLTAVKFTRLPHSPNKSR